MKALDVFHSIPIAAAVFVMQPVQTQGATARKIGSLSTLEAGWHYGAGRAISREVLERLSDLDNHAQFYGITQTDVFPGQDGDATFAVYRGEEDFYFRIHANGDIEFGSEWGTFGDPLPLTWQDALFCLTKLAASDSWKSFSFSTSGITTSGKAVSGALRFRVQVMGAGSRYLATIVPSENLEVFAPTRASTTKELQTSRQSTGTSTRLSSRKVTS